MEFGILSLLPALVVIVFAIWTRRTWEMLLLGAGICFIIYYKTGFLSKFLYDDIMGVVSNEDTMWIVVISLLFGSLIRLLRESGSTSSFADIAQKFAKTGKQSLLMTWVMGIIIFIDDYLSIMTSANAMMETCDRKKVPREMLAYVLDSTSAPVCCIIPISAWVVYFTGVFDAQPETDYIGEGSAVYYACMPYLFYAFICALLVPLVILGIVPKLGAMKKAWERTEATGIPYSEESASKNEIDVIAKEGGQDAKKISPLYFIVPMAVVIAATLIMDQDIYYGVFLGVICCLVMYIPTKVMSFRDCCEAIINGMCDMLWMAMIIICGACFREGVLLIDMPNYVISVTENWMSPALLPLITFIVVSLLAFVTSSVWSIPAVCTPIIMPLAAAVGTPIPLTMGAILSGAVFGAHACFYADVTVLSSAAARIDNMEHCMTQLPYALIGGAVAALGYLAFGIALT